MLAAREGREAGGERGGVKTFAGAGWSTMTHEGGTEWWKLVMRVMMTAQDEDKERSSLFT